MDGAYARQVEQAFLALLAGRGLRTTKVPAFRDRQDGYTEAWSYAEFRVDSVAEVFAAVEAAGADATAELGEVA